MADIRTLTDNVCAQRKSQICTRCHSIMYPKSSGSSDSSENHKPGYCSDGAPVHFKSPGDVFWKADGTKVDHAPFPQPRGLFINKGKDMDPIVFLTVLRDLYEAVVVQKSDGGEKALEYEAFSEILRTRTSKVNGVVSFKLYASVGLSLEESLHAGVMFDHNGARYLRLESLRD